MKIAFFTDTYHPSRNGVVTSTDTFRRELENLGHSVHIFAPASPHTEKLPGVTRVASMPLPTEPNCRVALPFPRTLLLDFARSQFDVIHTQTPFGLGIWGAALARMFGKPLVHTYHTFFAEYSHYLRLREGVGRAFVARFSRLYCNRCQTVIVPSEMFIQVLRSYHVTADIRVIPTGVAVPDTLLSREAARAELGLPADRPILLFVGRLAREKSIDFLLQAMRQLGETGERPGAAGDPASPTGGPLLVLVGEGPDGEALQKAAAELDVTDRVRWIGGVPHEEVFKYYAAADLFVFASRTETQGLVVAEALSSGLPVVAVRGPGIDDFVSPATGGFLTEPTIDAFLRPVRGLLGDPEARRDAAVRGRRAAPAWSSARQAKRLADLYASFDVKPSRIERLRRRVLASRVLARL